ncbi:MAG: hypothetical protein P8188_05960 [Gemmatimonadota bacterium]
MAVILLGAYILMAGRSETVAPPRVGAPDSVTVEAATEGSAPADIRAAARAEEEASPGAAPRCGPDGLPARYPGTGPLRLASSGGPTPEARSGRRGTDASPPAHEGAGDQRDAGMSFPGPVAEAGMVECVPGVGIDGVPPDATPDRPR